MRNWNEKGIKKNIAKNRKQESEAFPSTGVNHVWCEQKLRVGGNMKNYHLSDKDIRLNYLTFMLYVLIEEEQVPYLNIMEHNF